MRTPTEIVVFLPNNQQQQPRLLAEELLATVTPGRAEVGADMLTGNLEIRFYYDGTLLAQIREWMRERNVIYDISFY